MITGENQKSNCVVDDILTESLLRKQKTPLKINYTDICRKTSLQVSDKVVTRISGLRQISTNTKINKLRKETNKLKIVFLQCIGLFVVKFPEIVH